MKFLAYLWDFSCYFGYNRIIVFRKIFQRFLSYAVFGQVQKILCSNLLAFYYSELVLCYQPYRAFSHDLTAAILVFQNNETAAMLVFQTNSVGVELFSYVNASFFPKNLHRAGHVSENATFLRFLLLVLSHRTRTRNNTTKQ